MGIAGTRVRKGACKGREHDCPSTLNYACTASHVQDGTHALAPHACTSTPPVRSLAGEKTRVPSTPLFPKLEIRYPSPYRSIGLGRMIPLVPWLNAASSIDTYHCLTWPRAVGRVIAIFHISTIRAMRKLLGRRDVCTARWAGYGRYGTVAWRTGTGHAKEERQAGAG